MGTAASGKNESTKRLDICPYIITHSAFWMRLFSTKEIFSSFQSVLIWWCLSFWGGSMGEWKVSFFWQCSFGRLHLVLKVLFKHLIVGRKTTVNVEDLSASVFKRCKSIRHMILSGAAQNFFGQYASLKVFGNQILSGDDSIWRQKKVGSAGKWFFKGSILHTMSIYDPHGKAPLFPVNL